LRDKERLAKAQRIEEWRTKQAQEAEQKAKEEQEKQARREAELKLGHPEFIKKERQRLMAEYEKRSLILKKKAPLPPVTGLDAEVKQERAKQYQRVLKKTTKTLAETRLKADELEQFKAAEGPNRVWEANSLSLQLIFERFAKLGQPSGVIATGPLLMTNGGYNRFMSDYKVYPGLIGQADNVRLFRVLTKDLAPAADTPVGLNISAFKDLLMRIAVLSSKNLNGGEEGVSPERTFSRLIEWLGLTPKPRI
jgi:hypothetical protein